jgi:CBS domain-containing membrane protein
MNQLRVLDIMSREVVTVEENESLEVAEQAMQAGRIHHLPVLRRTKLVGVVTEADLLRASLSVLAEPSPLDEQLIKRATPVAMVMSRNVYTVAPDTPALRAAEMLRRHRFGCLPVLDGQRLVGIVTEGDFVELVIRALRSESLDELPWGAVEAVQAAGLLQTR